MDEESDPSRKKTGPRRIPGSDEPITAHSVSSNDGRKAPARRDGDVVLRDGSTVRIRLMRAEDEPGLLALLQSLSEESRWMRFYSSASGSALVTEAHREANLDQTFGLLAFSGSEERVVGHAFYAVLDEHRAEVAFTIANDFQGRGLGTILLGQLAEVALANSIQVFEAEVTYPLLTGFRGSPMCDVTSLEVALLRVSAMVEDIPQIAELDCNPFVVHERGATILDARIRVSAVDPRPLLGVRR